MTKTQRTALKDELAQLEAVTELTRAQAKRKLAIKLKLKAAKVAKKMARTGSTVAKRDWCVVPGCITQ